MVSKKKKKKKKKKVFTTTESDFSAGFVTFRLVGVDASQNGADLFEIEADFSAKIVTLRLVGGDASPPKSATGAIASHSLASRPKCRMRKTLRFSTFETVLCTGVD